VIVFVVGAPGVGKTTLLEGLLDGFDTFMHPAPKWTLSPPFALVGHYGQTFGGGDTLGYTQGSEAVDYMFNALKPNRDYQYFFLDGDRMSSQAILEQVEKAGIRPYCLLLTATDQALKQRCSQRGSNQNPVWAKGRKTKAHNFAAKFPLSRKLEIDTTALSPDMVRSMLLQFLGYCEACENGPCNCGDE